jgi:hypothetical protein
MKEAVLVYFKTLPKNLYGETNKNHNNKNYSK